MTIEHLEIPRTFPDPKEYNVPFVVSALDNIKHRNVDIEGCSVAEVRKSIYEVLGSLAHTPYGKAVVENNITYILNVFSSRVFAKIEEDLLAGIQTVKCEHDREAKCLEELWLSLRMSEPHEQPTTYNGTGDSDSIPF